MNRKEFFTILNEKLSPSDLWLRKISQAYWFAKEATARKDATEESATSSIAGESRLYCLRRIAQTRHR